MLSTHIMQEVEAMCQRVIIINKGKIVADGMTENMSDLISEENSIEVTFRDAVSKETLEALSGVTGVEMLSDKGYRVEADPSVDLPSVIFKVAVDNQTVIVEQKQTKAKLESVFQQLTKDV